MSARYPPNDPSSLEAPQVWKPWPVAAFVLKYCVGKLMKKRATATANNIGKYDGTAGITPKQRPYQCQSLVRLWWTELHGGQVRILLFLVLLGCSLMVCLSVCSFNGIMVLFLIISVFAVFSRFFFPIFFCFFLQ